MLDDADVEEEVITTNHAKSLRPSGLTGGRGPTSAPAPLPPMGPISVPAGALAKPAARGGAGKYVVMAMAFLAVVAIAIALLGKRM
jgi:hypothetical protein